MLWLWQLITDLLRYILLCNVAAPGIAAEKGEHQKKSYDAAYHQTARWCYTRVRKWPVAWKHSSQLATHFLPRKLSKIMLLKKIMDFMFKTSFITRQLLCLHTCIFSSFLHFKKASEDCSVLEKMAGFRVKASFGQSHLNAFFDCTSNDECLDWSEHVITLLPFYV